MARSSEFYKGTKKRRNYWVIPLITLLVIISVLAVFFVAMQKYAVITKDGVKVDVPMLRDEKTAVDAAGNVVHIFDTVETSIIIDEPDYSIVKQTTKGRVDGLRAIFVPYDKLDREHITEFAARLNTGNALVFEMKPRSGYLAWNSSSQLAMAYGTYGAAPNTYDLPQLLAELKEQGVYLAAQISCLVDTVLPSRNGSVALHNEYGGNFSDDTGMWLDPYNQDVRDYVVAMVQELYELGFDEVILADVMHPNIEGQDIRLSYTAEMSTTPNSVNGVSGFAMYVAGKFEERKGALSIYVDSPPSLVRADPATGQNAPLFFKLYERVYYSTDRAAYSYNLQDVTGSITVGKDVNRFVPVVINYLPPNPADVSWVLIDVETEENE